jgi:thiol-disulfide isomerase/thioredoxin
VDFITFDLSTQYLFIKFVLNMKVRQTLVVGCLFFTSMLLAQNEAQNEAQKDSKSTKFPITADGVVFFKGSFKDALKKAAAENKYVFIDVYTDWCMPCKVMAREAFYDADISDKMNAFFVNFKANPETGDRDIASRYGVNAFPTTIVVDSTGGLITKNVGYSGVAEFENRLDGILSLMQGGNMFVTAHNFFVKGKRDFAFLLQLARARKILGLSNRRLTDAVIKDLPADSLNLQRYKQFLTAFAYELEGKTFDYLLKNRQEAIFEAKLKSLIQMNMTEAIAHKDKSQLKSIFKANAKIVNDPSVLEESNEQLSLEFYQKTHNIKEAHNVATALMTKYYMPLFATAKQNSNDIVLKNYLTKIQTIGLYYADNVKEKKQLEEMSKLINKACEGHECVELLSSYSQMLYRMKDKEKAKELMNKAISMSNNDSKLVDILDKMNKDIY